MVVDRVERIVDLRCAPAGRAPSDSRPEPSVDDRSTQTSSVQIAAESRRRSAKRQEAADGSARPASRPAPSGPRRSRRQSPQPCGAPRRHGCRPRDEHHRERQASHAADCDSARARGANSSLQMSSGGNSLRRSRVNGVVETPRRARASIGDRGDDSVAARRRSITSSGAGSAAPLSPLTTVRPPSRARSSCSM